MTVKLKRTQNDNIEEIQVECDSLSDLGCFINLGFTVVEDDD
ncbi:MAG: hypothetical protein GOVbin1434_23 [Prokaryotic dsDNA virus sp.]|mgnify:FL=1|nr:MAG: hypothetical protein GOVbin1434_23 [Prokaryotic dsDNA virus sp.]